MFVYGVAFELKKTGGNSLVVKSPASDQKVAEPWLNYQTGNALLCPSERHFLLIFLWGQEVNPLSDCGGQTAHT